MGQFRLGWAYQEGTGTNQDLAAALHWYERAAEQGCGSSCNNIGSMYRDGQYVSQDLTCAVSWYQRGAAAGDDMAQYNLGVSFLHGKGVAMPDAVSARQWLRQAADQGLPKACFFLGKLLIKGVGGPDDFLGGMTLVHQALQNKEGDLCVSTHADPDAVRYIAAIKALD